MSTDSFEAVWDKVDADGDDIIHERDLVEYAERMNFDSNTFVKKWMNLFDRDGDKVIRREDFNAVLGLKNTPRAARQSPQNMFQAPVTNSANAPSSPPAATAYAGSEHAVHLLESRGNTDRVVEDTVVRETRNHFENAKNAPNEELNNNLNRTNRHYWHHKFFPLNKEPFYGNKTASQAASEVVNKLDPSTPNIMQMRIGNDNKKIPTNGELVTWRTDTANAMPIILTKQNWPNTVHGNDAMNRVVSHLTTNWAHKIKPNMSVWELEDSLNNSNKFKPHWNIRAGKYGSVEQHAKSVTYDKEGLIGARYVEQETELLIWRTEEKRKSCCWCCFF